MSMHRQPHVGLFVTCLVELFRPRVAVAARHLLERAGCRVSVPRAQSCCGQPAYNSGDRSAARAMARQQIRALESCDQVVVPSGSCAAMIARHYPRLFAEDPKWRPRAEALAAKTSELTAFLAARDALPESPPGNRPPLTYHDGCSGLRELGIKAAPRRLIAACCGESCLREMADAERCCGFGGLFAVKFDAVSMAIGRRKLEDAEASGAALLVAGELGCLLHLAGLARREGRPIRCRHVAEILAGMDDGPAIGEPA
ncbi:MAG: (Fe-S)-binding protein [Alphaproteobacteria bacterium]|nr:MAG: (Fe-S)-binding protein [Alphaproteobacteria bacterium]